MTTLNNNNHHHQNVSITSALSSTSPLNHTYHHSLRKLKNDERCFHRNNSLIRSFKRINNESYFTTPNNQQTPHHCTIELKTKATSCLHLFHKNSPPVILTTFKNQQDDLNDPQKAKNEILWRYHQLSQCDLNRKIKASSQCNLNNLRNSFHHHYHYQQHPHLQLTANNNARANEAPLAEMKLHATVENKTTL